MIASLTGIVSYDNITTTTTTPYPTRWGWLHGSTSAIMLQVQSHDTYAASNLPYAMWRRMPSVN